MSGPQAGGQTKSERLVCPKPWQPQSSSYRCPASTGACAEALLTPCHRHERAGVLVPQVVVRRLHICDSCVSRDGPDLGGAVICRQPGVENGTQHF
jgi:hypothetical protein